MPTFLTELHYSAYYQEHHVSLLCITGEGWSPVIHQSHLVNSQYSNSQESNNLEEYVSMGGGDDGEGERQREQYRDMERKTFVCP